MIIDKWKHLRGGLWANIEPSVELIGMTVTGGIDVDSHGTSYFRSEGLCFHPEHFNRFISDVATVSTGTKPKDHESLNRKLIQLGHHTPLEVIQYTFKVSGISKAAAAQISRHRIGQGHVSSSRRYQEQGVSFVYPLLDNIEDEQDAKQAYILIQDTYQQAYANYIGLRKLGLKKGDARYVIPTASAQERVWWINARALRDFLRLRLHPTAEAEVRRLSYMILNLVSAITPTLFEDFHE